MRLADERYEQIKGVVAETLELCEVRSYPIDVSAMARTVGFELCPYSRLGDRGQRAALAISPNGFKFDLWDGEPGGAEWRIYYNDAQPVERQRFTILHEIGHIVLGHRQASELAEAEANFFAKYAIAPPSLVHATHPRDFMDIAETFGTSAECALNSWNYYQKWRCHSVGGDYERALAGLFLVGAPEGGDAMLRTRKGA